MKKIWAKVLSFFGGKPKEAEPKQEEPEQVSSDIWSAAKDLHQQLKRGWDSAAKFGKIDLVEAGFDNFGNVYYIPAQILSIPVERFIAIDIAKLGITHGVDEPYLTAYNKMLRDYIDAKSYDKVSLLMDDFERRKTKFPQHETLLNLAALFLFRHDENPYNYSPAMQMDKINLAEKFGLFSAHWSPKIIGELNDSYIKLAKLKGEFDWHHHDQEDELFLVVKGQLTIKFRDREVSLGAGELIVIPKGVDHLPVAAEEVQVMLIEPKGTLNTGNVITEKTKEVLERI